MKYRPVQNRCAVIINSLRLPVSNQEAIKILIRQGFKPLAVNLVALARGCIGTSQYRRGAYPFAAPAVVDCSSFVKWLYGRLGIWLPRRSIQQRQLGRRVSLENNCAGDLVFVSGWIDYFLDDPSDGVGHVGICSGSGTVIHAAGKNSGVIETPLEEFVGNGNFRGLRRYMPKNGTMITFETPRRRAVETSDDLRWIVLQSLPKK